MIALDNTLQAVELCKQWINNASTEVLIASQSLVAPCLKEHDVFDELSHFVRRNQRTQLKILVSDPHKVDLSQPVVRLCQRLTSHCQIRVITDASIHLDNVWIIDQEHYIHWQKESASTGTANTNKPHSQKLHRQFFEQWHYNSEASAEFSLLHM